jgi:hypothetical protein
MGRTTGRLRQRSTSAKVIVRVIGDDASEPSGSGPGFRGSQERTDAEETGGLALAGGAR